MKTKTRAYRQSTITLIALITLGVMTCLLAGSLYFTSSSEQVETEAIAQRTAFLQLSGELNQAFDLLSQEAQGFAVESTLKQLGTYSSEYLELHSFKHLNAYWDEIGTVRTRERVMESLRALSMPRDELDLLAEAKRNSDALVDTETRSMRLTLEAAGVPESSMPPQVAAYRLPLEDRILSSESKRLLAVRIMFDEEHDRAKKAITGPIDSFEGRMSARLGGQVEKARYRERAALITLITTSGLFLLNIVAILIFFQTQIASPVMQYTRSLQNRGENNTEFALTPAGTQELRILADVFNKQWRENQRQLAYNSRLEDEEIRHQTHLKLDQMREEPLGELMDCALEAALALTRSALGYIFLYDETTQLLTPCSRSGIVPDEFSTTDGLTTLPLAEAGWLQEAIRERGPLIVNNLTADPHRKELAGGAEARVRRLGVPILFEDRIVLLIGVGNKKDNYDETDAQHLSSLMNDAWRIVAQRNAELELRESEARFRGIYEQAAVGIAHVSLTGRFFRVNQKLCDILGYSPEEMLALSFQDITHPDDLPADVANLKDLLESTIGAYSTEKRYLRKGGEPVWIGLTASLRTDAPRSQQYFTAVIMDISQRKKAEQELLVYREHLEELVRQRTEQLQVSENRMRALYRGVPYFLATWQRLEDDLVLTDYNDTAFEATGGKIAAFFGLKAAAYLGENPEILSGMEQCYSGQKTVSMETLYRLKTTGEVHHVAIRFAFVPPDLVLVHMDDIDTRKKMEEALREGENRLRLLTENVSDVIWTMELSGRLTYFSPSVERLLGYTPQEALQLRMEQVIAPGSLASAQQTVAGYAAQVAAGQPVQGGNLELEQQRKDGSMVWTELNFGGMYDSTGEFKGIVGATRDISERKRVDQAKADFVSFATHQLRTPLSGIKWMLELASDGAGTAEDLKSYIADAQASADRLIKLVNDLLGASRLEQGRISVEPAKFDLRELTRAVTDELRPLARARNQSFSFTGGSDPATVDADPQLLRQAILNLMSNAIKYTPHNGAIAMTVSREDGLVRWEVKDNGIGIPRDSRAKLFGKFFRADNAATIETEGTGLGLYLVRLIVERLGGHAGCLSEVGTGSTFYFTLPFAE